MKKTNAYVVIILLLISFLPAISNATYSLEDTIIVSYDFDEPSLDQVSIGDSIFDTIQIDDAVCAADPGKPLLPVKGVYLLLPPKTTYSQIEIFGENQITIDGEYEILPASKPTPKTSQMHPSVPTPDPSIYQSSSPYPDPLFDVVGTYILKGYTILVLNLYPVQYTPSSGKITYYKSMAVSVETKSASLSSLPVRNQIRDQQDVMDRVDNPELIETYSSEMKQTRSSDQYDMLILTTESLKESFIPLQSAHNDLGMITKIKTLKDITLLTDSISTEQIRDYIREQYLNHGIQFVLLGGDSNIIPARMVWVEGMDEEKWPMETFMPSDLYYGCLDGPYNYDDDNKWGEPTDGENGGDVDLLAEVYVGRAPVDNTDDVHNFVSKTISYMQTDPDNEYLNRVLMAGEYLGDYGIASWGGNYLDLLIDSSSVDGYYTKGISSEKYQIETLYDRDWPDYNGWDAEEIVNRVNNGVHIINHDGHAYYQYNMKMTVYDLDFFSNDHYFFDYSVGCMSGGFDNPTGGDCFAEYITVKTPHGAFAAIMNARYGYFWSYSTDGDGTRFAREFWDAVYREKMPIISQANQDSKEDNLFLIERSCMRWTYYELNLFGDPAVAFLIGDPPEKPETPQGETRGKPGNEYTFTTSTVDSDGEMVSYLFVWGDGSDSGWLGPFPSGEIVSASHSWDKKGSYNVQVKAKDETGMQSKYSDPLPVTMPTYRSYQSFLTFFQSLLNHLILR